MKRIAWLLLVWVVLGLGARPAGAAVTEDALRGFEKGKSMRADVVAALGQPASSATDADGLAAILYPAADGAPDDAAATALFASIGKFSATVLREGPAERLPAGFVFDRADRLVYFRAAVGGKVVTSEDGAGPMPSMAIVMTDQQSQASAAQQSPDKPHLGLQLVPTAAAGDQSRGDFAAAKFDGMIVVKVLDDSPAARIGMAKDDYVYMVNGYLVSTFDDVAKAMAPVNKGDTVRIRARRIDHATNLVSERVFDVKL